MQLGIAFDELAFVQAAVNRLSWTERMQPAADAIVACGWVAPTAMVQPLDVQDESDLTLVTLPTKLHQLRDVLLLISRCPAGSVVPPSVLVCAQVGQALQSAISLALEKRSALPDMR